MSSAVTARMAAHSGTMRRARTPGARPLSSSARISGSSDAAPDLRAEKRDDEQQRDF